MHSVSTKWMKILRFNYQFESLGSWFLCLVIRWAAVTFTTFSFSFISNDVLPLFLLQQKFNFNVSRQSINAITFHQILFVHVYVTLIISNADESSSIDDSVELLDPSRDIDNLCSAPPSILRFFAVCFFDSVWASRVASDVDDYSQNKNVNWKNLNF